MIRKILMTIWCFVSGCLRTRNSFMRTWYFASATYLLMLGINILQLHNNRLVSAAVILSASVLACLSEDIHRSRKQIEKLRSELDDLKVAQQVMINNIANLETSNAEQYSVLISRKHLGG